MGDGNFVSRKDFFQWMRAWEMEQREDQRRFSQSMQELRQQKAKETAPRPPPPPRRKESEGITVEDPKYADHLFLQSHALLGKLDAEEEEIIREHRAKRKPAVKRKVRNLVDTYSD